MIPKFFKTQDKFNPYLIAVPAFGALFIWQSSLIAIGAAKIVYEKIKTKRITASQELLAL